jgi:quercetin dioxygenase-like cupin family protein
MKGVVIEKIDPVYSDERGSITDVLNDNLVHVGLIKTKKGNVRGNHYHLKMSQWAYVLEGKFEVIVADFKKIEHKERIILNVGERIRFSPGIVHALKALQDSVMIDMTQSEGEYNYDEDVFKCIILS